MGPFYYNRADLESRKAKGEKMQIRVIGFLRISKDVTPALAEEVIDSLKVYGIFHVSDEVRNALSNFGKSK